MPNHTNKILAFNKEVSRKFHIYNGLFTTLPFAKVEDTDSLLRLFAERCRNGLNNLESPESIVNSFLLEHKLNSLDGYQLLFRILQFVERQVVLFDAIEDAAAPTVFADDEQNYIPNLRRRLKEDSQAMLKVREYLSYHKTKIVLTAHPTQFYPEAVLWIINDLIESISKNDINHVEELLMQLGKTKFRNRQKPSPMQEAETIIWFLKNIFYEVLPKLQQQAEDLVDSCRDAVNFELGFWPGGDRDGNPFVTASVTECVCSLLKSCIIKLYLSDIDLLRRRLTFDGVFQRLASVQQKLEDTLNEESCGFNGTSNNFARRGYAEAIELSHDLRSLIATVEAEHQGLFAEGLKVLDRKVRLYGFHFAAMDMRQDSSVHRASLIELSQQQYNRNNHEAERMRWLHEFLGDNTVKLWKDPPKVSEATTETVASMRSIGVIQANNGLRALERYIISNTQDASNVLEVLALLKIAGIYINQHAPLDIVPLFETVEDLDAAPDIMKKLYTDELYSSHLGSRGNCQTIMLGFSDGTKDGGYVLANWAIAQAKRKLTAVSRQHGVTVIFFDGRGGPPGRGGGNSHNFYRSLGSQIESKEIHLTIQGQTISSQFGTKFGASFNLMQLFTAGIENIIATNKSGDITAEQTNLLSELAQHAHLAYMQLREHPKFLSYLNELTPLRFYNALNIGSRPAKRGAGEDFRFEDLRAIPFVGAWTQMKQNIPGFYGFGTALANLIESDKLAELKKLYKECPFFRTLAENSMQSLSKSNFLLTSYMADDQEYSSFWKILHREYERTIECLKVVSESEELLEHAPHSSASIKLRESLVLPALVIQHYALQKLRKTETATAELEKLVIKSLAASINASRNAV